MDHGVQRHTQNTPSTARRWPGRKRPSNDTPKWVDPFKATPSTKSRESLHKLQAASLKQRSGAGFILSSRYRQFVSAVLTPLCRHSSLADSLIQLAGHRRKVTYAHDSSTSSRLWTKYVRWYDEILRLTGISSP